MKYIDRNGDELENGDLVSYYLYEDNNDPYHVAYWHDNSANGLFESFLTLKGNHDPDVTSAIIKTDYKIDYWLLVQKTPSGYYVNVMYSNGLTRFDLPFTNKIFYKTVEEALEYSNYYLMNKYNQPVMSFDRKNAVELRDTESSQTYWAARDYDEPSLNDVVVFILNGDDEDDYYYFYTNRSRWSYLYEECYYLQLPVISKKLDIEEL